MILIKKPIPGTNEAALERFLRRASRAAGVKGSVQVLITSSREVQALNRRFRGQDKATDVLSFPSAPGLPGKSAGDVAISADMAVRNARGFGHSPEQELRILILHALLHLAGHDHETDNGAMERKELRLRRALGLSTGLIERAGGTARSEPSR